MATLFTLAPRYVLAVSISPSIITIPRTANVQSALLEGGRGTSEQFHLPESLVDYANKRVEDWQERREKWRKDFPIRDEVYARSKLLST